MVHISDVNLDTPGAEKATRHFGILTGRINITCYDPVQAEEVDITNKFKSVKGVWFNPTDKGFILKFNSETKRIRAFRTGTPPFANGAFVEADADEDVGATDFIAIGMV